MFQKQTSFVFETPVKRPSQQGIPYPEVEEENLGVAQQARPIRAAPCRDSKHDERVLENLHVTPRRFIADAGVLAQGIQVENGARSRGGEVQQTGITPEIADQRLGLDFFAQVGVDVGSQILCAHGLVGLRIDAREAAMGQHPLEIEVRTQFVLEQRMKVVQMHTPGQQIRLSATELPGA